MLALEVCLGIALTAVISLVAFIWLGNTKAMDELATQLEKCETSGAKLANIIGIIEERLNNHLDWSAEVFTQKGERRPDRTNRPRLG